MSSFSNRGNRYNKLQNRKQVQKHVKSFYQIMDKLEIVAGELKKSKVEITEDNIEVEASKIMGRDIDSMEKFLLLGKIGKYEQE